jgi:phosphoribosylamine-glycine ligase
MESPNLKTITFDPLINEELSDIEEEKIKHLLYIDKEAKTRHMVWKGANKDYLNKKKMIKTNNYVEKIQLEGSKGFMKNLCKKNNIPTANFGVFDNFDDASSFIKKNKTPIVVKADGLAAGKGVSVCLSREEALKNTKDILEGKFKSSHQVVVEEFLEGEELSYFAIVDENSYLFFGPSNVQTI